MPPARPFSKKTAARYRLVHRPQNDPLTNDEHAPSQVFTKVSGPSDGGSSLRPGTEKMKRRDDLEYEFGLSGEALPENEEVAAEHGIHFNDRYDYLQHLRDLGQGGGDSAWIEATAAEKSKGKEKQSLEDALRHVQLEDDIDDLRSQDGLSVLSGSIARDIPSWQRYQEQQDIPDEIAGFQPGMDPRLREALEALEDDAYVDDDHDLFDELAEGGEEIDIDIWEAMGLEDQEDGWESDDTVKAANDDASRGVAKLERWTDVEDSLPPEPFEEDALPADEHGDGAFLEAMAKAKAEGQFSVQKAAPAPSAAYTTDTTTGRRKKRKGALTSSTGFSMTSSALARTEALSTLDSKFDKVIDSYMDDIDEDEEAFDDDVSAVSGISKMTGASKMSFASRTDSESEAPPLASNAAFGRAMDEFLVTNGKRGKKTKGGGQQDRQLGISQLDEVRKDLGPARIQRPWQNLKA